MKKAIIIGIIVIVLVAGFFVVKKSKKPVLSGQEIQPETGAISLEFRVTGEVQPRNRLEIRPQVSGRLDDILVVEGSIIKKGQIIAWMSSTDRAALLDAARAKGEEELKKWEDIYKPTPIIAPINGFVIARNKEPGQTVSGGDVILVMADELIVQANVDETDLRNIRLDQKIIMSLDAYPDKKFGGIIEHIAYEAVPVGNVTVYPVKIRPLQLQNIFRSGMSATIEVVAQAKNNVMLLPSDAITDKNGKKFVTVKLNGQKNVKRDKSKSGQLTEQREVEVGINNGKKVEIISGITINDIVVLPDVASSSSNAGRRFGGMPGLGGGAARPH